MAGLNDDEARELFEQHQNEQTGAGLANIARNTAEFRDCLIEQGFTRKEAFKLSREMLISLMDHLPTGEEDE